MLFLLDELFYLYYISLILAAMLSVDLESMTDEELALYLSSHTLGQNDGANDTDSSPRRTDHSTSSKSHVSTEAQPERVSSGTRSTRSAHSSSASDVASRTSDSPDLSRKRKPGPNALLPPPHSNPLFTSASISPVGLLPPPPVPRLPPASTALNQNCDGSPTLPAASASHIDIPNRHQLPDLVQDSMPPKRSKSESCDRGAAHSPSETGCARLATASKFSPSGTASSAAAMNVFNSSNSTPVPTIESPPSNSHHTSLFDSQSHEDTLRDTTVGERSKYFPQSLTANCINSKAVDDSGVAGSGAADRKSRTNSEPSVSHPPAYVDRTIWLESSDTAGNSSLTITASEQLPITKPTPSEQMHISREELYSEPQLLQNILRNYEVHF